MPGKPESFAELQVTDHHRLMEMVEFCKTYKNVFSLIEQSDGTFRAEYAYSPLARYLVAEEPYANGGMGQILLAYDTKLCQVVCLKRNKEGGIREEAVKQASYLSPFTARIYNLITTQELTGRYEYMVGEFVPGITLTEYIEQKPGRRAPETLQHLVADICTALQGYYDHQPEDRYGKMVLFDIKPDNILLRRQGKYVWPIVMDFGLAFSDASKDTPPLDGTLAYISPERLYFAQSATPFSPLLSDIFSLGIVITELLTGRPVFFGTEANIVEELNLYHCFPFVLRKYLEQYCQTYCLEFAPLLAFFEKIMAKDPAHRYQSFREVDAAFAGALQQRQE